MGQLYNSRANTPSRPIVFNGVTYTARNTITITANSKVGTPEFVFVGVPEAVVRRYVDAVEKASQLNDPLALGLYYQSGSTIKQPIPFVGLNDV